MQNTGWGAYLFFAIFCVLSGIWAFLFVRETNGRMLEEMDSVFDDSASAEDEERRRIEELLVRQNGDSRTGREIAGLEGKEEGA